MKMNVYVLLLLSIFAMGNAWGWRRPARCQHFGTFAEMDREWWRLKDGWRRVELIRNYIDNHSMTNNNRYADLCFECSSFGGSFQALEGSMTHLRQNIEKFEGDLYEEIWNRGDTNEVVAVTSDELDGYDYNNLRYYSGMRPIVLPVDWEVVCLGDGTNTCNGVCCHQYSVWHNEDALVCIEKTDKGYCVKSRLNLSDKYSVLYRCSCRQLVALKIWKSYRAGVMAGISAEELKSWSWARLSKSSLAKNECYIVFNGDYILVNRR